MNISPINNYQNTNFNGKVITRGSWPKGVDKYFELMPQVAEVAKNSKYNIIGKMHCKTTQYHPFDDKILRYRLTISAEKENPTLLDRIKNLLGLNPKIRLSQHHHRGERYPEMLEDRIKNNTLTERLGLNK